AHRRRAPHDRRCPVHVTLRACADVPSLRRDDVFAVVRAGFTRASTVSFRVLHFSVQRDHVHLLVEAEPCGLRRGVQGLTIRIAKAINRTLRRRGKVWGDRYHARALTTPREVRHALVYVLQNWRKHLRGVRGLDPRSSAGWFTGWRTALAAPPGPAPVVRARTWLASVGWRRCGLLGMEESPHAGRRRAGINSASSVCSIPRRAASIPVATPVRKT